MSKKILTVQEAVSYLETLSDSDLSDVDICQLPPDEPGNITEEEDILENDFEPVMPKNVCGMIDITTSKYINQDKPIKEPQIDFSTENKRKIQKKRKLNRVNQKQSTTNGDRLIKKSKTEITWKKIAEFKEPVKSNKARPILELCPNLINLSPIDIFFKTLPHEYIEHLVEMTKLYALQKGETIDISSDDILQFFGLLLLSGYHSVPKEDMYWNSAEDIAVPIVSTVMPRNRFRNIKKFFHLVDNNQLRKEEKLGKVTPIYTELSKNLQKFGKIGRAHV